MKIIAVDDDGISLSLLKECLMEGGYEHVTLMSSACAALDAIKATSIAYDCILLDVEMPEKDGIELCADIRRLARYRNTPILMITRHKDHAAVARAFANGATDYITKPFEFFEVLTRIKVAERLVQERQAALDSYIAVHNVTGQRATAAPSAGARKAEPPVIPAEQFQINDENLLSLSVFQNYLEQATRADGCEVNLFAVKIKNIDRIFANSDAAGFVNFLKTAAAAVTQQFDKKDTFLAHAGNGIFLCATQCPETPDTVAAEAAVLRKLQDQSLPQVAAGEVPIVIVIGSPLVLTTTPKLNFKRAVKAATARAEQRERDMSHVGLTEMAG